jgi:hypothetical protein
MVRVKGKFVACVFLALSIGAASGAARATEFADLWYNPAESGWGMQTGHQANTMFATLYVFGQTGLPTWFTGFGTATTPGGSTFTGTLSTTTGPYYGAPFTSPTEPPVVTREAGTFSFQGTSPTTATLTYVADGVTVTKSIQRLALASHNLAGSYIGSFLSVQGNCANPSSNGPFNGSGAFTIVHNPPAPEVTITAVLTDNLVNFTCTYQGSYSQLGRIGSIAGTFECSSGQAGTWNANEIEVSTLGGILGRYAATNAAPACQITGGFGGLKPST